MAYIRVSIDNVGVAGIVRIRGYYDTVLLEVNGYGRDKIESLLSSGDVLEIDIVDISHLNKFLVGTIVSDYELARSLKNSGNKENLLGTFDYEGFTFSKFSTVSSGPKILNSNITYKTSEGGARWGYVEAFYSDKSNENSVPNVQLSGDGPGIYLRFNDNGTNRYVLARFSFSSVSKSAYITIKQSSSESNRYKIFMGPANTILNEIPNSEILNPSNPFPIDPSGPNIPGGQFDDQSDIIGDSSLPTLSASDTGFTRIYIPTLSQVKDLARYLWTDDTVIETIWNKIKQFFENPMEAIIGFNLVPVPVPSSGTKSFALMYIDTGVDMDTAANQFVDVDCGTLPIQLYYGSALDYSPYTKVSCYLPYIGMVQLNTDEVVGRTLQVKYRIDIVSGSCVAKIFVDGNCIYQYSGHCAITIPIAASDFSSYVSAAISVAKLAVGAATGGSAGAAAAALNADVGQQTGSMFSVQSAGSDGGQIQLFAQGGASGPGTQTEPEIKNTQASFSGITPQNVANTVGEIMTAKPHVQHSGSFSGNSGYLGVRRPFVIIERPNLCLPENYQGLNGFPAMITMLLGECSGYTKVQQMVLSGCTATNPEQAEIMSLLKGGVIF